MNLELIKVRLMSDESTNIITLKEYRLDFYRDLGFVWISRPCGESWQVKIERFEELIDKFYTENF